MFRQHPPQAARNPRLNGRQAGGAAPGHPAGARGRLQVGATSDSALSKHLPGPLSQARCTENRATNTKSSGTQERPGIALGASRGPNAPRNPRRWESLLPSSRSENQGQQSLAAWPKPRNLQDPSLNFLSFWGEWLSKVRLRPARRQSLHRKPRAHVSL